MRDRIGVVVHHLPSTAQDHVAVLIPGRDEYGRLPMLRVSQKRMRVRRRQDCFNSNLHVSRGSVLEPNRTGKARNQLPMDLTLGGTRANGSPTDQGRQILGSDHVEELSSGRHSHLRQIEQQAPCQPQAVIDLVRLVEVGIVDQSLPSDRGARLLEVNAHHDAQFGGELCDGAPKQARVLSRRLGVVNRTRPAHHQQTTVSAAEDLANLMASPVDGYRGSLGGGHLLLQKDRRKDDLGPLYAQVIDGMEHDGLCWQYIADANRSEEQTSELQ